MKKTALILSICSLFMLSACSTPEQRAFKKASKEAQSGKVDAQIQLADMYLNAQGTEKNVQEATRWYIQAAQQQDTRAFQWLRQQALQGNTQAGNTMTQLIERGNVHFAQWMLTLAEQGDSQAQYAAGWMYDTGKGLIKDKSKAQYWYQKAADQGNVLAKQVLGNLYYFNKIPSDDPKTGIEYLKTAALENKNNDAAVKVAHYYHYDVRDGQQALNWYRKSAELGDQHSQQMVDTYEQWKNEGPLEIPTAENSETDPSAE